MKGKRVCYIHGGKSTGAPKGNQYGLKHGGYTKEQLGLQKLYRQWTKQSRETLKGKSVLKSSKKFQRLFGE